MFRKALIPYLLLTLSLTAYADDRSKALSLIESVQTFEDLLKLDPPFKSKPTSVSLAEELKDRIIIAGDSWAVFPCGFKSMEKVISATNAKFHNDERCHKTSKLGMDAKNWLGSIEDKNLTTLLETDSRIKYVYLSLGGNDLMAEWNVSMSPAQELVLFQKLYNILQNIMDKYIAINPQLKIILSGYDFPNFRDNHAIPMYRKIYKSMGEPTPHQVNNSLIQFTHFLVPLADFKNRFYVHHLGLAHYYDGYQPSVLGLPTTANPSQISSLQDPGAVGGNIYYPSRDVSMMIWVKAFHDPFHLTEENYFNVLLHTYNNVLANIAL